MANGIFGPNQEELGAGQQSPFRPAQPVVNRAAADAFEGVANIGSAALEQRGRNAVAEQQANLESQQNEVTKKFQNELLRFSRAVQQGRMGSSDARTRANVALSQFSETYPDLAADFRKVQKDVMSTSGMGSVIAEGTEQEQMISDMMDRGVQSGHINPTADDEEQWAQLQDYFDTVRADERRRVIQAERDMIQSRLDLQSAERQARLNNLKDEQREATVTFVQGQGSRFRTQINQIVQEAEAGQIDQQSAMAQIRSLRTSIESDVRQNIGNELPQDYLNNLLSPLERAQSNAEKVISGEEDATFLENENRQLSAAARNAWYSNPRTARVVEGSRLLGDSPLLQRTVEAGMRDEIVSVIEGFDTDQESYNPFPKNERSKQAFRQYIDGILQPGLQRSNSGTRGSEELDQQVGRQLEGMLEAVVENSGSVRSLTEFQPVVGVLSSEALGRYVERTGGLPEGVSMDVKQALNIEYTDNVVSMIRDEWDQATVQFSRERGEGMLDPRFGTGFGQSLEQGRVAELLKPEFSSGSVRFTATGPEGKLLRQRAQELNRTVAPVLNKLIKMSAHMDGNRNYREVFRQMSERLFAGPPRGEDNEEGTNTDGGNGGGPNGGASNVPEVSPAVDTVFNELGVTEGRGDNVTDVETGNLGVTEAARKSVDNPDQMSDSEIARSYLTDLDQQWREVPGYEPSSETVKEALLDTTYNMGPQVMRFPKLKNALKNGNEVDVVRNLLDTASVGDQALRGLAKRRAMSYNRVADVPIDAIEQQEDGTLVYQDREGNVIFKYKPSGGRHEKSPVGVINVPNTRV